MIELVDGDCLDVLGHFAPGSFDVITTSPPYNLGIDYKSGYDDKGSRDAYLKWSASWLLEAMRVLAADGSLFLSIGGKPTDPMVPFQVLDVAVRLGFVLQNTLFWIKSMSENDGPCEGHVKPLNSPRFVNDAVEHVFHMTKTGRVEIDRLSVGVPFADQSNLTRGKRGKNGNVRCRGNAWCVPYKTIKHRDSDRPHPATFPPELAAMCMKLHGVARIKNTLDPFSGLGSSARAAKSLGLSHVGIELSTEDNVIARGLLV